MYFSNSLFSIEEDRRFRYTVKATSLNAHDQGFVSASIVIIHHVTVFVNRKNSPRFHSQEPRRHRLQLQARGWHTDCDFLLPEIRYPTWEIDHWQRADRYLQGSFGCTKEACQFRDALVGRRPLILKPGVSHPDFADNNTFKESNLQVIGISPDSVEAQAAFVEKQKLTVIPLNTRFPAAGSR